MATITLNFANTMNPSLQVGDVVYYCQSTANTTSFTDANESASTTISVEDTLDQVVRLGTVLSFTATAIVVDTGTVNVNAPDNGDYVFFGKDNAANISSLAGYYASVKFVNNSTTAAELFSISAQATESSK
tara:strand:- start:97 stop:489 length:393 start_codon:yes stop_codon:yes gene_type:complete